MSAAAIRFARQHDLDIGVKCGGHSVLGLSVPDDGLMIDLTPMGKVRIDSEQRRAYVGGGALLRYLDQASLEHGLATTAGNVSHTGVGGLTLGGGMGWLARQFGLACDNVERFEVVTADGDVVQATSSEHADLFWGLRGGGGNFGVVTEFEFRLHPVVDQALMVDLIFDADEAVEPLRRWRDLLPDAPREATLTADAVTSDGRPIVAIGFVWVGDTERARAYLRTMRSIGTPRSESVEEMAYRTSSACSTIDITTACGDTPPAIISSSFRMPRPTPSSVAACHLARRSIGLGWRAEASRPTVGR